MVDTAPTPDQALLARIADGTIGNLSDALSKKIGGGDWVSPLLSKASDFVASKVEDRAVAAGLNAAISVLSTPEARATLATTTQGAFTALAARIGLGTRGDAREEFIRNRATFDERHAMLRADTEAAIRAKANLIALVDRVEGLAVDFLAEGGAHAALLLVGLL